MTTGPKPTEHHLKFLRLLAQGTDYERACYQLSGELLDPNDILAIAFQCTLHGWTDRGRLTDKGRALLTLTEPTTKTTEPAQVRVLAPASIRCARCDGRMAITSRQDGREHMQCLDCNARGSRRLPS